MFVVIALPERLAGTTHRVVGRSCRERLECTHYLPKGRRPLWLPPERTAVCALQADYPVNVVGHDDKGVEADGAKAGRESLPGLRHRSSCPRQVDCRATHLTK